VATATKESRRGLDDYGLLLAQRTKESRRGLDDYGWMTMADCPRKIAYACHHAS
jgi:hypothetical protein